MQVHIILRELIASRVRQLRELVLEILFTAQYLRQSMVLVLSLEELEAMAPT